MLEQVRVLMNYWEQAFSIYKFEVFEYVFGEQPQNCVKHRFSAILGILLRGYISHKSKKFSPLFCRFDKTHEKSK